VKGILMRPDMIQAIVEGRKTVTRRLDGLKEINREPDKWRFLKIIQEIGGRQRFRFRNSETGIVRDIYPRYQVGETVYIKEVHYRYGHWKEVGARNHRILYKFDAMTPFEDVVYFVDTLPTNLILRRGYDAGVGWYKRTPLFMPEWAARHFITILAVRAERLQGITLPDCEREGFALMGFDFGCPACDTKNYSYYGSRIHFAEYWDSLNPTYPWESNPWVFPYEFEYKGGK